MSLTAQERLLINTQMRAFMSQVLGRTVSNNESAEAFPPFHLIGPVTVDFGQVAANFFATHLSTIPNGLPEEVFTTDLILAVTADDASGWSPSLILDADIGVGGENVGINFYAKNYTTGPVTASEANLYALIYRPV